MRTWFSFRLPLGITATDGTTVREGVLRLPTVLDELEAAAEPAVRDLPRAFEVHLLARLVARLGPWEVPGVQILQRMFSADFRYLLDFCAKAERIAAGAVVPMPAEQPGLAPEPDLWESPPAFVDALPPVGLSDLSPAPTAQSAPPAARESTAELFAGARRGPPEHWLRDQQKIVDGLAPGEAPPGPAPAPALRVARPPAPVRSERAPSVAAPLNPGRRQRRSTGSGAASARSGAPSEDGDSDPAPPAVSPQAAASPAAAPALPSADPASALPDASGAVVGARIPASPAPHRSADSSVVPAPDSSVVPAPISAPPRAVARPTSVDGRGSVAPSPPPRVEAPPGAVAQPGQSPPPNRVVAAAVPPAPEVVPPPVATVADLRAPERSAPVLQGAASRPTARVAAQPPRARDQGPVQAEAPEPSPLPVALNDASADVLPDARSAARGPLPRPDAPPRRSPAARTTGIRPAATEPKSADPWPSIPEVEAEIERFASAGRDPWPSLPADEPAEAPAQPAPVAWRRRKDT